MGLIVLSIGFCAGSLNSLPVSLSDHDEEGICGKDKSVT